MAVDEEPELLSGDEVVAPAAVAPLRLSTQCLQWLSMLVRFDFRLSTAEDEDALPPPPPLPLLVAAAADVYNDDDEINRDMADLGLCFEQGIFANGL